MMKQQSVVPDVSTYSALMQVLAGTGQIVAGFELLAEGEEIFGSNGALSHDWYPIFRMLLEGCRAVGDSQKASRVKAEMDRLGLVARMHVATTLVEGSVRKYEYGVLARLLQVRGHENGLRNGRFGL